MLEEEVFMTILYSCRRLFLALLRVSVGVGDTVEILVLVLVYTWYIHHDLMVRLAPYLGNMLPDSTNTSNAIKLCIQPIAITLSLVMLLKNFHYVPCIYSLDSKGSSEKLSNGKFHLMFLIMNIVHSTDSINILVIYRLKAKSQATCFKPLFDNVGVIDRYSITRGRYLCREMVGWPSCT